MELAPSPKHRRPLGPPPDRPLDEYPIAHEDGTFTLLVYINGKAVETIRQPKASEEFSQRIKAIQDALAPYRPTDGSSVVDELIADRRREAEEE